MRFDYKVPGVYKEGVLLRTEPGVPTGIPGFVGFAYLKNEVEISESLTTAGVLLPQSLQGKLRYDVQRKLLVLKGAMTLEERDMLLKLFSDESFTKAVKSLYERSRGNSAFNSPVVLHRKDEFDTRFEVIPGGYLAEAIAGFFLNGGLRCYLVCAEPAPDREAALKKALESLAPLSDVDLIAIPDAMALSLPDNTLDEVAIIRVQREMLAHCDVHGGRLAILDALPGRTVGSVKAQCASIIRGLAEPVNGALYYPWLKISREQTVPACGHVAGIYARSDARAGVFKAPANEEILGVLDLEVGIDNSKQGELNPEGINCLRAFPGRGIRVWGARTISRDPNWRYVNVRRLFLTLQRWIDVNMAWASFEPATPELWVRIRRELTVYLNELWRAGALVGENISQAFYVKCDAETNPPEVREAGQTVTEIGLAPGSPAEFVVVRIIHHTGVEPR